MGGPASVWVVDHSTGGQVAAFLEEEEVVPCAGGERHSSGEAGMA